MTLHLQDPDVVRLARALSRETGEAPVEAVRLALEARLARVQWRRSRQVVAARVAAIQELVRVLPEHRDVGAATLLYDERGLPGGAIS